MTAQPAYPRGVMGRPLGVASAFKFAVLGRVALNAGSGAWAAGDDARSAVVLKELSVVGLGNGVFHVGKRTGDLNNSYTVGAYNRLDAAVYDDFDAHDRLSVNMRNLTNARYIEQPFNQSNNAPGAPFSVLATLTAPM